MFQQPLDFLDESNALYALLAPLGDDDLGRETGFKNWSINDIITHLHMWNWAADLSLTDEKALLEFIQKVHAAIPAGGMRQFEDKWIDGLTGTALVETWRTYYAEMAQRWMLTDPKARLKWAGPDMSVLSSITARLMETWAHGQAVYDLFGIERIDSDRIRNIAVLGVNTFKWTFINRQWEVPENVPQVRLTAPSGGSWCWNESNSDDRIAGSATEFCQVVTQTRNIADTGLTVTGKVAGRWMANAQCFAGPPETPPEPGTRTVAMWH
ncbi:MAG: TIGR03084 family metal-binding protein [Arenicellales bacterium]|jgi:uncharacterized protein (TIGR03084 family)|nr:TIGR03084 family protein [Dehalococcoidales bacterium]MDP6393625.1 TIGR03084 family metal-binding protein [Arenicellales bacterium]MDP7220592.1 TIGR03084 family metal-binding protein [Arenicellales bacterium]|tara:strand:- start:6742 stop:7545 length:804 start_codon:yes stop_codon:yes gene_type:complete